MKTLAHEVEHWAQGFGTSHNRLFDKIRIRKNPVEQAEERVEEAYNLAFVMWLKKPLCCPGWPQEELIFSYWQLCLCKCGLNRDGILKK
jgi:hypothetical protein